MIDCTCLGGQIKGILVIKGTVSFPILVKGRVSHTNILVKGCIFKTGKILV